MFFTQERYNIAPLPEDDIEKEMVTIVKIRTMKEGSELAPKHHTGFAEGKPREEDPLATKLGKFIRKYNLDELP